MNARITIGNATILRLLMGANVNITGQNGLTPYIGSNGNWWIGITDTGFKVVGNDGLTPYIKNGNWWIGEIDTGVAADAQPWTPIFSLAMDGSRYVQKLTSYVGGSGAAPTANIGQYLKSDGTFTSVITEAATYTNAEALSSKVDKGGSDKTLKQVEDEIVQLAGDVSLNTVMAIEKNNSIRDIEQALSKPKTNQDITKSYGVKAINLHEMANGGGMDINIKGLTSNNLVTNGDFRNGLTGWQTSGGTIQQISGNLVSIGDGTNSSPYTYRNIVRNAGDIYYIRARVRVTNSACTKITLSDSGGVSHNHIINNPTLNEWYDLSVRSVFTETNMNIIIIHTYVDAATASGKSMEVDHLLAINITNTFGSGEEPSIDECAEIYDAYFEGEKNVTSTSRIRVVDKSGETVSKLYLISPDLKSNGSIKDEIRRGVDGYEMVRRINPSDNTILSTPSIIPVSFSGILNSVEGGILYKEPVIKDRGEYKTNMTISSIDYPISSIEEIIVNGTYLDVSEATVSADGLSFTHPDLISGDLILFTYIYNKEGVNGLITANYHIKESNRLSIRHKALMVGIRPVASNVNNISTDLYRNGFTLEHCSITAFCNNYETWSSDYDLIILTDTLIPYQLDVTAATLRTAISHSMNVGCKLIMLFNNSAMQFNNSTYGGSNGSGATMYNIIPVRVRSVSITGEVTPTQNAEISRGILNSEYKISGVRKDLYKDAGVDGDIVFPVQADDGINTINLVAYKKNSWAIIANGGTSSGYVYIDYSELINELFGIDVNDRLAMDSMYGKKAAAIGVDADYTTDIEAITNLLEAVPKHIPLEVGLVANSVNDNIATDYRGLQSKYPNLFLCSHTYSHYGGATKRTVIDEVYVINSKGFIILKKPFKARITSITSLDGLTTYTYKYGFIYGMPTDTEYYTNIDLTYGDLVDGYIKFSLANVGVSVKVSYTYQDDNYEIIQSINKLNGYGCLNDKVVYSTMGYNSISATIYDQAERLGITLCEYYLFPSNYRASFIQDAYYKKAPNLNGNTLKAPLSGADDVSIFKRYSFADFQLSAMPFIINMANQLEIPYVSFIHDILISLNYAWSVYNDPASYNADWKKPTETETVNYIKSFYTYLFSSIDAEGVKWVTRGEYSRFYQHINKYVEYNFRRVNNKVYLYVKNNSDKVIDGVTFKVNLDTTPIKVSTIDRNIEHSYNNGIVTLWIDLSPGANYVVEIY
jgi:hypothetical protein